LLNKGLADKGWKKMRFVLPIICVFAFCIVSVVVVDAVMPLGYILGAFLKDDTLPIAVRILLLAPFAGTLFSSFVNHTLTRSILTSASVLALTALWILGLILFVVFPMPDTQVSNAVPAITSIPFLLAAIATITRSVRSVLSERRPKRIA
jgi:hypothetical protein